MKTLWRLTTYILSEKLLIFSGLLLTAVIGLSEVFTGAVLKLLTDSIKNIGEFLTTGNKDLIEIPLKLKIPGLFIKKKIVLLNTVLQGENEVLKGMIIMAGLFAAVYLIQVLSDYFRDVFLGTANQRIMKKIKKEIFSKLILLPASELENEKPGDLISRVTYDAMVLSNLMNILVELVRSFVYMLIFIPLMFIINWKIAVFTAIFFPLTFFLIKKFSRMIKRSSKMVTDSTAEYTAFLEERVKNLAQIKACKLESQEIGSFNALVDSNYLHNVKLIINKNILKPTNEFMGILGVAIAAIFFSYMIVKQNFNAGNAVLFLYMMKTSYKPFKKVAEASGDLFNSLVCAEKIFKLLDRK
ncbi:MAG TPA: ABC transporter transmembrane domain-containing protein [bacterium]|nr:ABC transporter transmembrane domain-containing protein [bacterium]HPS30300.1 ABC transporter transmembrane domain-containing protein [bacterium]